MVNVLIMTHETLGQAYVQLATHFFGNVPDNVRILGVCRDDAPEVLSARARAVLSEWRDGSGVLMLTDIFGATPCNIARQLIDDDSRVMVTGLNAPMMVKAMQYAADSDDVRALAEAVKAAAVSGIMIVDQHQVGGWHA